MPVPVAAKENTKINHARSVVKQESKEFAKPAEPRLKSKQVEVTPPIETQVQSNKTSRQTIHFSRHAELINNRVADSNKLAGLLKNYYTYKLII